MPFPFFCSSRSGSTLWLLLSLIVAAAIVTAPIMPVAAASKTCATGVWTGGTWNENLYVTGTGICASFVISDMTINGRIIFEQAEITSLTIRNIIFRSTTGASEYPITFQGASPFRLDNLVIEDVTAESHSTSSYLILFYYATTIKNALISRAKFTSSVAGGAYMLYHGGSLSIVETFNFSQCEFNTTAATQVGFFASAVQMGTTDSSHLVFHKNKQNHQHASSAILCYTMIRFSSSELRTFGRLTAQGNYLYCKQAAGGASPYAVFSFGLIQAISQDKPLQIVFKDNTLEFDTGTDVRMISFAENATNIKLVANGNKVTGTVSNSISMLFAFKSINNSIFIIQNTTMYVVFNTNYVTAHRNMYVLGVQFEQLNSTLEIDGGQFTVFAYASATYFVFVRALATKTVRREPSAVAVSYVTVRFATFSIYSEDNYLASTHLVSNVIGAGPSTGFDGCIVLVEYNTVAVQYRSAANAPPYKPVAGLFHALVLNSRANEPVSIVGNTLSVTGKLAAVTDKFVNDNKLFLQFVLLSYGSIISGGGTSRVLVNSNKITISLHSNLFFVVFVNATRVGEVEMNDNVITQGGTTTSDSYYSYILYTEGDHWRMTLPIMDDMVQQYVFEKMTVLRNTVKCDCKSLVSASHGLNLVRLSGLSVPRTLVVQRNVVTQDKCNGASLVVFHPWVGTATPLNEMPRITMDMNFPTSLSITSNTLISNRCVPSCTLLLIYPNASQASTNGKSLRIVSAPLTIVISLNRMASASDQESIGMMNFFAMCAYTNGCSGASTSDLKLQLSSVLAPNVGASLDMRIHQNNMDCDTAVPNAQFVCAVSISINRYLINTQYTAWGGANPLADIELVRNRIARYEVSSAIQTVRIGGGGSVLNWGQAKLKVICNTWPETTFHTTTTQPFCTNSNLNSCVAPAQCTSRSRTQSLSLPKPGSSSTTSTTSSATSSTTTSSTTTTRSSTTSTTTTSSSTTSSSTTSSTTTRISSTTTTSTSTTTRTSTTITVLPGTITTSTTTTVSGATTSPVWPSTSSTTITSSSTTTTRLATTSSSTTTSFTATSTTVPLIPSPTSTTTIASTTTTTNTPAPVQTTVTVLPPPGTTSSSTGDGITTTTTPTPPETTTTVTAPPPPPQLTTPTTVEPATSTTAAEQTTAAASTSSTTSVTTATTISQRTIVVTSTSTMQPTATSITTTTLTSTTAAIKIIPRRARTETQTLIPEPPVTLAAQIPAAESVSVKATVAIAATLAAPAAAATLRSVSVLSVIDTAERCRLLRDAEKLAAANGKALTEEQKMAVDPGAAVDRTFPESIVPIKVPGTGGATYAATEAAYGLASRRGAIIANVIVAPICIFIASLIVGFLRKRFSKASRHLPLLACGRCGGVLASVTGSLALDGAFCSSVVLLTAAPDGVATPPADIALSVIGVLIGTTVVVTPGVLLMRAMAAAKEADGYGVECLPSVLRHKDDPDCTLGQKATGWLWLMVGEDVWFSQGSPAVVEMYSSLISQQRGMAVRLGGSGWSTAKKLQRRVSQCGFYVEVLFTVIAASIRGWSTTLPCSADKKVQMMMFIVALVAFLFNIVIMPPISPLRRGVDVVAALILCVATFALYLLGSEAGITVSQCAVGAALISCSGSIIFFIWRRVVLPIKGLSVMPESSKLQTATDDMDIDLADLLFAGGGGGIEVGRSGADDIDENDLAMDLMAASNTEAAESTSSFLPPSAVAGATTTASSSPSTQSRSAASRLRSASDVASALATNGGNEMDAAIAMLETNENSDEGANPERQGGGEEEFEIDWGDAEQDLAAAAAAASGSGDDAAAAVAIGDEEEILDLESVLRNLGDGEK